jgi:hypothetical protein
MNDIKDFSPEEIEKIKKSFSSINQIESGKLEVKDWLDDSVQTVTKNKGY